MSSLTFDEAYDEILTLFRTGWLASAGFPVFYEDVPKDRESGDDPYAKVFVNFGESHQSGFCGGEGGIRLYNRVGDFRCELHTLAGNGLLDSLRLVKVITDTFEGKRTPGGVWFRSVNVVDIGRNGAFRITDVAVFFNFDERK